MTTAPQVTNISMAPVEATVTKLLFTVYNAGETMVLLAAPANVAVETAS